MASKRKIRRKSCTRKVRYETENDAKTEVISNSAIRGCLVYKCRFCNGFHIGHPNSKIRKKMNARKNR